VIAASQGVHANGETDRSHRHEAAPVPTATPDLDRPASPELPGPLASIQTLHLNCKGRKARGDPPVFSALEAENTRVDPEDSERSSLSDFLKYRGPLRSLRALR
jgi:hypothetical protein